MLILTMSIASLSLSLCSFFFCLFIDMWCFVVRVFPARLLLCVYRISSQHHLCWAGLSAKTWADFSCDTWCIPTGYHGKKGRASVFKNETAEGVSIAFFKMPTLRGGKIMAATCPPITL